MERAFGRFSRSLTLPKGVDPEAVTASFSDGVLEVRIPKPEERKPRKISIAVGESQPAIEGQESSGGGPARRRPPRRPPAAGRRALCFPGAA